MNKPLYKHILLKLSGEALMGNKEFGIDLKTISQITEQISSIFKDGIKISIVVGGGNIFRGISAETIGMDRTSADYTGMMATVINALLLQNSLEKLNLPTRVLSAIKMDTICEPYIKRRAIRHIEKNRIVIFAAGTGNPFFTTDSAACLRAIEVDCDLVLKATKVDGVYDSDPVTNPNAVKYDVLDYETVLAKQLGVMDLTAICLVRDHGMPVRVFNMNKQGALVSIVRGESEGTLIDEGTDA